MSPRCLVEVALTPPIPGKGCLTYSVPDNLLSRPLIGARVVVPLGRSTRTGLVVRHAHETPVTTLKPIAACLDPEPFLDQPVLDLCDWAARYYMAPLAEVVATIVPARMAKPRAVPAFRLRRRLSSAEEAALHRRAPRQWTVYRTLAHEDREPVDSSALAKLPDWAGAIRRLRRRGIVEICDSAPSVEQVSQPLPAHGSLPAPAANNAQQQAIDAIEAKITEPRFHVFLLFGVTGSGKTNVYLTLARTVLAAGRSVIVLLPEIALTEEIAARFRQQFGNRTALLHSALSPAARWSEWNRARRGEATVIVGPRSALFAPLPRLGLLVVDEEHDPSYKQEEGVRYNGRDLAVVRARQAGCPIVLGSATPSVESFHHAETGRYTLLELRERAAGRPMPVVSLVRAPKTDFMPSGSEVTPGTTLCSEELRAAIESCRRQGEQTLLFLNRRGFAHFVQCLACGEPASCTSCSVPLTLHRARGALVCHHCGFVRSSSLPCVQCGKPLTRARNPGTEQIAAQLNAEFPSMRVARMDRDATARRGEHGRLLRAWHAGEIDVLVGTQMVTKGVDNPRVTLVGVLNADLSLNLPDFRAAERTLQLITQVAGRAGRGEVPGRVLVQTLRPDHYSLRAAADHDYRAFYAAEIDLRRVLGYPPFRRLINVRLEAREAAVAERVARDVAASLRRGRGESRDDIDILGPAPAPLARLRGWHRWQVLIRGPRSGALHALLEDGMATLGSNRRAGHLRIVVDVDPYSML